jgi:tRNA modification GTPase
LIRPWQVVLAGHRNVGKSSLINALVGFRRAIVHHTPGTTRDVVTVSTALDGWPVELSDTAGFLEANLQGAAVAKLDNTAPPESAAAVAGDDAVERAGIELARERLACADLVFLVFDASTTWSEADQALIESWPGAILVDNKCDLPPAPGQRPSALRTSATVGHGIEALQRTIVERLIGEPPPLGAAVPFSAEQIEQLARYEQSCTPPRI